MWPELVLKILTRTVLDIDGERLVLSVSVPDRVRISKFQRRRLEARKARVRHAKLRLASIRSKKLHVPMELPVKSGA